MNSGVFIIYLVVLKYTEDYVIFFCSQLLFEFLNKVMF